jgi:uncharacterized protein YdhG (YjbR/CyaY superfamily)
MSKSTTIDEYIAGFPKETQAMLEQVRNTIRNAAPEAEETISYDMPTFTLGGSYLIYFIKVPKDQCIFRSINQCHLT